jgi:ketosteroid isomerase-like protein
MLKIMSFITRALLILVLLYHPAAKGQSAAERQIRQILKEQEKAWNRGELKAFMKGYWESDSLLFIGRKGPVYGYAPTLANYLKSYPDTAHMGHFTSTVLQVQRLSAKYYMVVGKWELRRSAGDIGGYYTLLFRRLRKQWLIVQDHSS